MANESIWTVPPKLDALQKFTIGTMVEHLDIRFEEVTPNSLIASMPVDHRTVQPYGIIHGGATATLAETIGSLASQLVIADPEQGKVVGIELNINHLRQATKGRVYGETTPVRIGRRIHVWQIDICDEQGKLVSRARLTVMVIS